MREDHTSAMLRLYREPSSGRLAWYSRDFLYLGKDWEYLNLGMYSKNMLE